MAPCRPFTQATTCAGHATLGNGGDTVTARGRAVSLPPAELLQ